MISMEEPSTVIARMICFHHSGGAASSFRLWPAKLPRGVQVVAVQLPARENRYSEAPILTVPELLAQLIPHLEPFLDRPYFIFGHSMGAALGYLAIQRLAARQMTLPLRLFVSACAAPTKKTLDHWRNGLAERSSDDQLIANIEDWGGTPRAILDDRDYLSTFLSTMRADMRLLASFPASAGQLVSTPITALLGDRDDEFIADGAKGWPLMTTAPCDLHTFSGGHFYMQTDADAAFTLISTKVAEDLAIAGARLA